MGVLDVLPSANGRFHTSPPNNHRTTARARDPRIGPPQSLGIWVGRSIPPASASYTMLQWLKSFVTAGAHKIVSCQCTSTLSTVVPQAHVHEVFARLCTNACVRTQPACTRACATGASAPASSTSDAKPDGESVAEGIVYDKSYTSSEHELEKKKLGDEVPSELQQ